jgi:hypothetical protein
MPLQRVISILQKEAGSHFAPEVVSAFLRCLPQVLNLYRGTHFEPEYVDEVIRRLAPETLLDPAAMSPSDLSSRRKAQVQEGKR